MIVWNSENLRQHKWISTLSTLLERSQDIFLSFQAYRNTLLSWGASSAQCLIRRQLRESLPVYNQLLKLKLSNHRIVQEKIEIEKQAQMDYKYNRRHKGIFNKTFRFKFRAILKCQYKIASD